MKILKNKIWRAMLLAFFTLSSGFFSFAWAENDARQILATVNGVAISQHDLDIEFNRIEMQAAGRQQPINASQVSSLKNKILETLINRELLYQDSLAKGISAESSEVEAQVDIIKQRISSVKSFSQTIDEIGISEKKFRKEVSKAIMIKKTLDANVYQKVSISEKEMRIFYDNNPQFFKKPEEVKASHILIKVNPQWPDEQKEQALKKIEEIQAKLRQGQDFAELAKQFSECPSSKSGGDLGFFDRKKMVKPFSDAAFSVKPGEISDIVETQFGYHIIKIFEKKHETKLQYADIKERLGQNLKQQKIQKETSVYINQLKKDANIQRMLP
jgi:peptidyl-prolyl cis-trans isomerase C